MRLNILTALVAFAIPAIALSQSEVVIQDSSGFTRATASVEQAGDVQFSVVDAQGAAADGVEVTLTNATTGEVLTAKAVSGSVSFESIGPGAWTVSTATPGITFTNVAITSSLAAAGISGATIAAGILGTGAVAGGAVAIAESNNGNSNDTPLSPAS